jgi:hypothetical protein
MRVILSSASIMMFRVLSAFAVLVFAPLSVFAQTESQYQIGVHVTTATSSEFDATDVGIGALVSWRPGGLFGADAELTFYPSDFADEPAFSASRVEGLFGITVGPRIARSDRSPSFGPALSGSRKRRSHSPVLRSFHRHWRVS